LALLLLVSSATHWSSRVSAGGEEWRPVDPADLALKSAVVEPNADAEAIFWDIRIDDGGENDLVLNHNVRIKTFAFPGIEPGAIIEYKWKEVRSNSSANNMRLQFQRDIPVQAVTYR